jgi:asparagine N-glycosylation enzyme membrane subunit Stt3
VMHYKNEKKTIKNCISFISGSLIFTVPYLILNTILYKNPLYPFIIQGYLARYTGWMWWEPIGFYFTALLKENYLFIFALIGAAVIIKNRDKNQLAILSILALYAMFYTIIAHKETRFLISLLPYLFLAAAYGIVKLTDMALVKKARIPAIALLLLAFLIVAFPQYKAWSKSEIYEPYYEYLNSLEENEGIWITNPLYILETNKKAELIYYWTFDAERARQLQGEMSGAKHILLNECDIPCQPWNDGCPEEKQKFISMIQKNFEQIYYKENSGCDYYILAKEKQA